MLIEPNKLYYENLLHEENLILESLFSGFKDKNKVLYDYKKQTEKRKNTLKSAGININLIENFINDNIVPIKKGDSPEVISNAVKVSIINTIKKINQEINIEDIPASIMLLLIIIIINSIALEFLTILFGEIIGFILTAVIIGPLVEEMGKNISIKNNFSGTFLIVFNIGEFTLYMNRLLKNYNFVSAALIRTPALFIHYVTTMIQKNIIDNGELDKNIDQDAIRGYAYYQGVILHGIYNALAIISELAA